MIKHWTLPLVLSLFAISSSFAASAASDNAANAAYAGNTWPNGSNGGTGFGVWSFATTGGGGRFIGATGESENPSFGIFAGGNGAGDTSSANRPFTGALSLNQTFSVALGSTANVDATNGGVIGLNLLDGATPVFTFKFTGGTTFWALNDGGTDFNTNIPFSANTPINLSFTYNGAANYTVKITEGATSYNPGGTMYTANDVISNINGVRFFSNAQGGGENFGFNNLLVSAVPEPSSIALLAGPMILGGWFFVRRRRA